MGRLSLIRWLFAWIAILGMLSSPLAAARAMDSDHGSATAVTDLVDQAQILMSQNADTDACCTIHQSGKTVNDCGKLACVGAASCMAKCVPGTVALFVKAASAAFGSRLVPSNDVTVALFGPEPPMEPPRS